jgi:DNA polymerase (family 10)
MQNHIIAAKFNQIRKLLKEQGEKNSFRLSGYFKAANAIESMDQQLVDVLAKGAEEFKAYCEGYHVGDRSREKIVAFIQTGTCPELETLIAKQPVVQESFLDMVGVVVNDPKEKAPKQRKASENLRPEVTAVRRPLALAEEPVNRVLPIVEKYFELVEVCGSYRRKKVDVKDIDIAASKPRAEYANDTIASLFTKIEDELGITTANVVKKGEAQTAFYLASSSGDWHIDIWYVPAESWGSAILFATGPMEFNVDMRGYVKSRGMKLNRYGLFKVVPDGEDVLIASKSEAEIFDALGVVYVDPTKRFRFDPFRLTKDKVSAV